MDQGPLVNEEIDEGAELVRQFGAAYPVKAAFWLKASNVSHRYLSIASDQIDDRNVDMGYREVMRLTLKMRSPYLDPFQVKVVGGANPLAQAAAAFNDRFPGSMGARFGDESFGGVSVDDGYIYPRLVPAAPVTP